MAWGTPPHLPLDSLASIQPLQCDVWLLRVSLPRRGCVLLIREAWCLAQCTELQGFRVRFLKATSSMKGVEHLSWLALPRQRDTWRRSPGTHMFPSFYGSHSACPTQMPIFRGREADKHRWLPPQRVSICFCVIRGQCRGWLSPGIIMTDFSGLGGWAVVRANVTKLAFRGAQSNLLSRTQAPA